MYTIGWEKFGWENGIITENRCALRWVGNFDTVSGNGIFFPHQWGISIPFPNSVSKFPTSGEKGYRFPKWYRYSPPNPVGGEKRYRFSIRYRYSPPVGKKDTVSQNGIKIPHQGPLVGKKDTNSQNGIEISHSWGKSIPFPKTVSKLHTNSN